MPAHYPNYMQHAILLNYLHLYAERFDLLKYIHFQVITYDISTLYNVSFFHFHISQSYCSPVSDHSGQCEAEAGLLSHRPVGGENRKHRWSQRNTSVRCCVCMCWKLHTSCYTSFIVSWYAPAASLHT